MAETVITPYASAVAYATETVQAWLDTYNGQRVLSYDTYDDMYNNSPEAIKLLLRGSDDKPIYVPTAKRIINTFARYVARGWGYKVDIGTGTTDDQTAAITAFGDLFRRERVLSQFSVGKPEWLRRGDWVWMLSADPLKPAGKRISIKTIDPRTYFVLQNDEEDVDRVTGCQIIQQLLQADGKTYMIDVQTWLKYTDPSHSQFGAEPSPAAADDPTAGIPIEYEHIQLDTSNWSDPTKRKLLAEVVPQSPLPGITELPLYHIKNQGQSGDPYGESELKGLESVVAGINQAITDEDLSLALAGLGMYWTDSGAPVDETTGAATGWNLGPQQVVEIAQGRKFDRIAGITSVAPVQDHVGYLEEQAYGTSGINDIALGSRGSVTESGIALAIRMQPLFDAADEREIQINDVMSQMFYDLQMNWFPTYEQLDFPGVVITSSTDSSSRLPFDRAQAWTELATGFEQNMFTLDFVYRELVDKFGYDLTAQDLADALAAQTAAATAADPIGTRATSELTTTGATSDVTQQDTTTGQ